MKPVTQINAAAIVAQRRAPRRLAPDAIDTQRSKAADLPAATVPSLEVRPLLRPGFARAWLRLVLLVTPTRIELVLSA